MIVSAAVVIFDNKQNKEVTIPVHRHCDAFLILHDLGYKRDDFKTIAQGFLDEYSNFYSRVDAWEHAWLHGQLPNELECNHRELFSEDLY